MNTDVIGHLRTIYAIAGAYRLVCSLRDKYMRLRTVAGRRTEGQAR